MGKEMYDASAVFRQTLDRLQDSLDSLPEGDRPGWRLIDELSAPKDTSRIGMASISQPVCTALQVAFVDVLHAAGVEFAAVVGHSSGEIGAAYAAGYLGAQDAIRVAYYRGFHSHLAEGPDGKRGKMMAVGMGLEQAWTFCKELGEDTLKVAASNSPTSCTLAGDAAVVDAAKQRLDQEGTFARVLAVDTAYHSHHMQPCARPYLESLHKCGVRALPGPRRCTWYSSVWGPNGRSRSFDDDDGQELLRGQYWVDNLTNTVQFSQAVNRAVSEEPYILDLALEVGPHPALKGPTSEVIKSLTGVVIPHGSVCKRGEGAIEAFLDGLGLLWTSFPSPRPAITFSSIHAVFPQFSSKNIGILKGLPPRAWDHSALIWRESRSSRKFRTQQSQPSNELLGFATVLGEQDRREVHWRQIYKLSELPWVRGHTIQGEILFPAAAYLTMAYEAAVRLVDDSQPLSLVELHDIEIVRPMSLQDDSAGLEVVFTVRITGQSPDYISAQVACYSGDVNVNKLDGPLAGLTAHFSGGVRLWLGSPQKSALPSRNKPLLPMDNLNMEQLYSYLSKVGYNYSGHFTATSVERHLNHAVVTIPAPPEESTIARASLHPAALDTAIQGLLSGLSYPEDGRLRTVYLPTAIDCVRINMAQPSSQGPLKADSHLTFADSKSLAGDIDIFSSGDAEIEVQMRGVRWTALDSNRERDLYASEQWLRDATYGLEPALKTKLSAENEKLRILLVRTARFYLRKLRDTIKPSELIIMGKHRKHMMKWIREYLFPQIEAGKFPDIDPEWSNDSLEDVQKWSAPYLAAGNNDMQILHAVGENLAGIARGTVPALQVMLKDGMLNRLYMEGVGFSDGNLDFEPLVKQLGHRYPRMKICEIGAGTGGTTKAVLSALGDQYTSYTYTDISAGFFEEAKAKFSQHASRMTFKTLNIEKDPAEQGFEQGSFDLVVSSNCLHATKTLHETLSNARRLLRPGGYLMLLEITKDHLPIQLIMSTLPGWFLGIDDGRVWAPTVSLGQWDALLKKTGFTGVDTSSTPSFCSVILSQATDERIQLLREPLSQSESLPSLGRIHIFGSSKLAHEAQELLAACTSDAVDLHKELEATQVSQGIVLCTSDLDMPVFEEMTQERFDAVQTIFRNADAVLWVTSGAHSGKQPTANITLGLGRTLLAERSELKLQFLDVDDPSSLKASEVANMLLRIAYQKFASLPEEVLWSHEPHVAMKDGALYIPRVLPLEEVNRRSAAKVRPVDQDTSLKHPDTAVEISSQGNGMKLLSRPVEDPKKKGLKVHITASSLCPLANESSLYICVGKDIMNGGKVIGLSASNSSIVSMPEELVLCRIAFEDDDSRDALRLRGFIFRALAIDLLADLKGSVWVHGASHGLSSAVSRAAKYRGLSILQTTSNIEINDDVDQAFIHPFSSERDLLALRLASVQTLIDLERSGGSSLSRVLKASLPSADLFTYCEGELSLGLGRSDLLKLARQHFLDDEDDNDDSDEDSDNESELRKGIMPINNVPSSGASSRDSTSVVDWTAADHITTVVRPVDHKDLFSEGKTYVLFGMTGDVGISIARWMVANGARNIVLTSRNPSVPSTVFDYFAQRGATLRTVKVDVTNKEVLKAAVESIKSNMPPIGGIINGAMVLRDRLFVDMPWADFDAVLAPKVLGTQNIDEVLESEALDFFIVLSSATSFVGIAGQSAYSAANHFMASLVRQRRERGLPGSSIVIGFLTGLGYIFRSEKEHLAAIEKSLLPRLERQAETDLHEMLAEAIVCGRPESNQPAELITGVRKTFSEPWHEDPRLSCYLAQEGVGGDGADSEEVEGNVKVETQLAAAQPEEAQAVLEKCFSKALGNMLQLEPSKISAEASVADLGVDSLVSVRVREWFLKELGVEVPILKIMSSNQTVVRLCEDALAGWRKAHAGASGSGAVSGAKASQEPAMDWKKELNKLVEGIPAIIPPGINTKSTESPRSHARRVVLTGCTGFLGTHMIRTLVADPDIAEVHCLCIRSRHVSIQHEKIREYKGDLAKPFLGLFIDDFIKLSETADLIIHVGAEVNHLKSYEAVRAPNVISTQILLAMARPRRVPVHFISSSSVAMLQKDTNELPEIPPSGVSPPTDAESLMGNAIGYAASKWMGEMLLEHAGTPAVVHRFPNIMGPDAPDEIPLVALDRYCTKMRAVPALDPKKWVGHLDIIDVSDVVPEFVGNAFAFGHDSSPAFAVHNYCSANRYLLSDLAGMYKEKLGGNIEVWPTNQWMRRARALGMPKGVEVTFSGHDEVFVSPVLRKGPK